VLTITDTHQHLIYPERYDYAWTVGIAALEGRAFRQADYTGASRGCGIGASVFMEATGADPADHDEAAFIGELAADRSTRIVGIVAACRPEHPGFAAFLDSLAGSPVVGLRRVLHVVDDEVSRDSLFRENVRRLAAPALTFDLCVLARQLPLAHELAAAAPQVSFVLDHCGVPDIAVDDERPHLDAGNKLAAVPIAQGEIGSSRSACRSARATIRSSLSGEHVHSHNLRSDHIPIELEEETRRSKSMATEWLGHTSARRPQGDSQRRRRGLPRRVRASRRAGDRRPYGDGGVHVVGFPGCYPNDYAFRACSRACARIRTSARCCSCRSAASRFRAGRSRKSWPTAADPVETLVIQERGGTRSTVAAGRAWVAGAARGARRRRARAR
jgi:hypothetical protein